MKPVNRDRNRSIKFYTLGCKVNQYETQSIREDFIRHGFKEANANKKADLCLINTCTVTSAADRKSRNLINRAIRQYPNAKIIVTGCLVKKDKVALAGFKGASLIIDKAFFTDGISDFPNRTRAFLKVQDGCNNFCSYCKVPLVRGKSKSREVQKIIDEARVLAGKGFKEVVLTGICLGSFGKDLHPKVDLVDLIKSLEGIRGLIRIRLSSIEVNDVTQGLIDLMAKSRKLCHYLHIPLQSGDDEILKRMNRKYRRDGYSSLVKNLRKMIPDISVTTDVLVGFPGETEVNFRNTMDLLEGILPLKVHIFPYSKRPGTAASRYKSEITGKEIDERLCRLKRLSEKLSLKFRRKFLNNPMRVLIENRSKASPGFWEGYTDNYLFVRLDSGSVLKNKVVPARIISVRQEDNLVKLENP